MDSDIRERLCNIYESITSIEDYLGAERNFDIYMANKMLRRAIERELEIIGEATNRIDKKAPNIPLSSKRQIVGMRNRLIHGYYKIDNVMIWGIIARHLPVLEEEVSRILYES
ncbi:hypothetical protein EZS27_014905 [termite gut metagenome]|uniref:DUF86 domain-containing protein n=1 Tax=termite gut metagenome TaxID=433724 RepID=A0A5J4RT83_9ZZZZ